MRGEPGQGRSLVKRTRSGIVEMRARLVPGRSAGMKFRRSFLRTKAGQLQFLEGDRRDGRNLRPMRHVQRQHLARLTEPAIRGHVRVLQGEKVERQLVE